MDWLLKEFLFLVKFRLPIVKLLPFILGQKASPDAGKASASLKDQGKMGETEVL
jgi:hypothetical protein